MRRVSEIQALAAPSVFRHARMFVTSTFELSSFSFLTGELGPLSWMLSPGDIYVFFRDVFLRSFGLFPKSLSSFLQRALSLE